MAAASPSGKEGMIIIWATMSLSGATTKEIKKYLLGLRRFFFSTEVEEDIFTI